MAGNVVPSVEMVADGDSLPVTRSAAVVLRVLLWRYSTMGVSTTRSRP